MNRIVFFLLISFFINACKDTVFYEKVLALNIKNEGNIPLVVHVSESYPDTIISEKFTNLFGVPIKKTIAHTYTINNWSKVFARTPKDTLSVFIFSGDTVAAYSWDEIRSGYKVLKRFDLSQQDLEAMNYTVTYP